MKHGGLLNKYFCKKENSNIPNDLAEIVNFHFSHYKSMGTISCHSNQSSYPTGSVGNRKGKSLSIIGKLLPIDYRLRIENLSIA